MTNEPSVLLLTMKEVARLLAVSERTVFTLCKSGLLSFVKIGASKRVPVSAVEAFLASRVVIAKLPPGGP